ncbi:hypothetical protein [Brevibacterium epidermidis]|uniref:hypothetical protein n=1 Tax=Brevibacterium epidermidis TaxID=1698 RepID=UPI000B3052A7|nr:hypothetical protein [Brevibacterium epidermidis]
MNQSRPHPQKTSQLRSPGTSISAAAHTEMFSRLMLWFARCLICLAVALYIVPPLNSAVLAALFPLLGMMSGQLITGLRSLLIVWCVPLVVVPILSPPFASAGSQLPMSFLPDFIRVPAGLTLFFGVTYLAWNIVRNRRWWILLLSFVWSAIVAVVQQLMFFAMVSFGAPPLLMTAVVVALSLLLAVGGFGIFHLLGRIRGATVSASTARSDSAGARPHLQSRARESSAYMDRVYGP